MDTFDEGEQMMPNPLDGCGHTAVIHTQDAELCRRFAAVLPASRILVNSPAVQGIVGLTTGLLPSATFGCGTFGGNSTTDNVSFRHCSNIKRLAFYQPEGTAASHGVL